MGNIHFANTHLRGYVQFNKYTHTHTHTHTSSEVFLTSIIDHPLRGSMRVAWNDEDDRAELRGYVQFNKYTHSHTHTERESKARRGG